jgi:hypothetical protein
MAAFLKDIGPADIIFDGSSIGAVQNVVVTINQEDAHGTTGGTGIAPVSATLKGRTATVACEVTQATLAQLNDLIPGSDLGDGAVTDDLRISVDAGLDLTSYAKTLIVKPKVGGTTSTTAAEWIIAPKAYPRPAIELPYNVEDQRVFNVEFVCMPVLAADLLTGGFLYKSGTPDYAADELIIFGKEAAS